MFSTEIFASCAGPFSVVFALRTKTTNANVNDDNNNNNNNDDDDDADYSAMGRGGNSDTV